MAITCPFCGAESKSRDHCTHCHAQFNDEIRELASDPDRIKAADKVGPFSTKVAGILAWILIGVLVGIFVVVTQIVQG